MEERSRDRRLVGVDWLVGVRMWKTSVDQCGGCTVRSTKITGQ